MKVCDDLRFEPIKELLHKVLQALYTFEATLSEDAKGLRRLVGFMQEAVICFLGRISDHTILDFKE